MEAGSATTSSTTAATARGWGSQKAASDVIGTAGELGLERYSVLGHSMGGSVMQQVLVQAPERVTSLVGVSPVPADGVPFDDDGWALFSGAAEEPGNRRAIIDLTTGNRLTDVWLDAAVQASLATSDKAAFGAYLGSWAKTDFHQQIEGNPVPVKVIVGEHDPTLGEATMQATFVQWYPNCELEVLANAGQPLTRPVTHFS